MPDEYIGIWDDGTTSLTFSKLFDMKEKLIKWYGYSKEETRALATFLADVGVVFFGSNFDTNFREKKKLEELRAEPKSCFLCKKENGELKTSYTGVLLCKDCYRG